MVSDLELKADVEDELETDGMVESQLIGVTAEDGVVTLTGTVRDYHQRFSAVAAVKRVQGVKAIADEIEVVDSLAHKPSDTEIAATIVHELNANEIYSKSEVIAKVTRGHVTLTGNVSTPEKRNAIEKYVLSVPSVNSLDNLIVIHRHINSNDVLKNIRAEFVHDAEIQSDRIDAEVSDSKIELHGQVRSDYEKNIAIKTAEKMIGVNKVIDGIKIDAD